MVDKQVIDKAIETFGTEHQHIIALEELSELQKEITKHIRGIGDEEHLLEELVDVLIIIDELIQMHKITKDQIFMQRHKKIKRLEQTCEKKLERLKTN